MQSGGRFVFGAALVVVALLWAGARADAPPSAPLPPERLYVDAPGELATQNGIELRARYAFAGRSGWQVTDLDTGEVLDAHEADRSFAPASVAKLPTALFALHSLGPNHRFFTRLSKAGLVTNGSLQGDLFLVGGGDPELDSDGLAELVDDLARLGIKRVNGQFIVLPGSSLRAEEIDPDQPGDVAFNPAVSGLNLNFNRVRLRWGRSAGDQALSVSAKADRVDPPVEQVEVQTASANAPLFQHDQVDGREVWTFNARALSGDGSRWLPVRGPELYAGDVFRQLARTRGVNLPPPTLGKVNPSARVIAERPSRTLDEILRDMLRFSTNLTAEVVGAAAARVSSGTNLGSLEQSAALMNGWISHSSGFSPGDPRIRFVNHSGLSAESRVAPSRIVGLLASERMKGTGIEELLTSISVDDADDPLEVGQPAVLAKTGTMDRIRGLAGYITLPSGRRLAFAIFSNHLAGRLADRRAIAGGWMRGARAFERALIRNWVRRFDG
ncbi:MAG: D-alanyl-D-alanine carboxypeptidase/D-alanyl-D-alanine-endopeptidase [Pseudomonadota bacterium]